MHSRVRRTLPRQRATSQRLAPAARLRDSTGSMRRIIRRFWPLIVQQRGVLIGAMLAMLAEIALRLLEPWPLKLVFDFVLVPAAASTGVFAQVEPTTLLALAAAAVVAIAVLRASAAFANTIGFARASNRVMAEVRSDLYRHIQRLSLSFHTQAKTGDLITRITVDIGRMQDVTITAVLPLVVNICTLIGMLGLMLWLNWQLALLALVTFPLLLLSMNRLSGRIHHVARKQRQREGALAATAAEAIGAIKVVQALSIEGTFEHAFASQNSKSLDEDVKGKRLSAGLERTVDVTVAVGTALVLWYGAQLALRGVLTPGDLLVFITYLKNAFKPARDLAKYTGRIAKATASGERVLDVLDTLPEIRDAPNARSAPDFAGAVRFEGVTFGYEPGHPVLHDFTLDLPAGTRTALVGASGSGKSTLASLLLRFYDPEQGRVLIDDHDIRCLTLKSLRTQIAMVPQESALFAVSVRENIALGSPWATPAAIEAAARRANAHDFIMALPEGYDTVLAERGASLSGGQRQRIAIARAMVREAPLVILDEPATGLDNENERDVMEALDRLIDGRTTLLITHDLRAAQNADLILYMEEGQVLERGTHAELLQQHGTYARLYALQASERNQGRQEAIDVVAA